MDATPQVRTDPALWQRLSRWRRGDDGARIEARVQHKLSLRRGGAARATDEYVRFLYLALTTPDVVAPSAIVDEVWHLHLLDSRDYFDRFCPTVLGRTLHHRPGRPAPDRDPAYERTRARYAEEFGAPPPADVWPDTQGFRRLKLFRTLGLAWFAIFAATLLAIFSDRQGLAFPLFALCFVLGVFLGLFQFWLPLRKGERSGDGGCGSGGDGCGGD